MTGWFSARRTTTAALAALAALVTAGAVLAGGGAASASTGDEAGDPCDYHNLQTEVRVIDSVLRYYRVELTEAPGSQPCTLAGTPQDVVFYAPDGSRAPVTTTPGNPRADEVVTVTPDHPAHFDLRGGTEDLVPVERLEFSAPALDGTTWGNRAFWPDTLAPGSMVVGLILPGA